MLIPPGKEPMVLNEYGYKFELGRAKPPQAGPKGATVISTSFTTMSA